MLQAKDAEKRWGGRADEISWKLEKTRLQETLREKTDEITRLEKSKLAQKLDIEHLRTEVTKPSLDLNYERQSGDYFTWHRSLPIHSLLDIMATVSATLVSE